MPTSLEEAPVKGARRLTERHWGPRGCRAAEGPRGDSPCSKGRCAGPPRRSRRRCSTHSAAAAGLRRAGSGAPAHEGEEAHLVQLQEADGLDTVDVELARTRRSRRAPYWGGDALLRRRCDGHAAAPSPAGPREGRLREQTYAHYPPGTPPGHPAHEANCRAPLPHCRRTCRRPPRTSTGGRSSDNGAMRPASTERTTEHPTPTAGCGTNAAVSAAAMPRRTRPRSAAHRAPAPRPHRPPPTGGAPEPPPATTEQSPKGYGWTQGLPCIARLASHGWP